MKTNKYQGYLNDKDTNTSDSNVARKAGKVIGTTVKAAAVIGGGYYGLKYLNENGHLDKISERLKASKLSEGFGAINKKIGDISAISKAFSQTAKDDGALNLFLGKSNSQLEKNLQQKIYEARTRTDKGLGADNTKFENILQNLVATKKEHATRSMENVQFENIASDIKESFKDNEELGDFFTKVLSEEGRTRGKLNDRIMNQMQGTDSDHEILRNLLERHKYGEKIGNSKIGKEKAEKSIMEILKKNKMRRTDKEGNSSYTEFLKERNKLDPRKTNRDAISENLAKVNNSYMDSIVDSLEKKPKGSAGVAKALGMKNLTVGDAAKQGIFDLTDRGKNTYIKTKSGIKQTNDNAKTALNILLKDKRVGAQIAESSIDPMVFLNKDNNLVDLRGPGLAVKKSLNVLAEHTKIPFVNLRPFKMLENTLGLGNQNTPLTTSFLRGTVMPTIEGHKEKLKDDYFFFNNKLVNSKGEMIKDNAYISSSNNSAASKAIRVQAGMSSMEGEETNSILGNFFKNTLGIGQQDFDSIFGRKKTVATKFFNPEWLPNKFKDISEDITLEASNAESLNKAFGQMFSTVDKNTKAMSRSALKNMTSHLDGVLSEETLTDLTSGNREDATMKGIIELLNTKGDVIEGFGDELAYKNRLKDAVDEYLSDPEAFFLPYKNVKPSRGVVLPSFLESVSPKVTQTVSKFDEVEKLFHAELLHQANVKAINDGTTFSSAELAQNLISAGVSKVESDNVMKLDLHYMMQKNGGANYRPGATLNESGLKHFKSMIIGEDDRNSKRSKLLGEIINDANPVLGYGPGKAYAQRFTGNDYVITNKATSPLKSMMTRLNESIKAGEGIKDRIGAAGKGFFGDTANQMGFGKGAYGRRRMDKVTTLTNATHSFFSKTSDGFGSIGFGLSTSDMGSSQDVFKNLALKRVGAAVVGIAGVRYINDELGNLTGTKPSQALHRSYANTTVGVQAVKEITGINSIGRQMNRVMPGGDLLFQNPVGKALKYGTFGIIGDNRSPGEMKEYYTTGVDPVRRGRNWAVGSSTPIYGDKIEYFKPNAYRMSQADPKMSDSLYGSTGEYWSNHWLPNPRNPFGALKPGRRQHWINKHKDSRPYPTNSSGMEEIPLIGPALDASIGRIVKPFRRRPGLQRAHESYLEEINEMYKYNTGQQKTSQLYMTASGKMDQAIVQENSMFASDPIYPNKTQGSNVTGGTMGSWGGQSVQGTSTAYRSGESHGVDTVQVMNPNSSFSAAPAGSIITRGKLTQANQDIINKAYVSPVKSNSIQSLRDNIVVENLDKVGDPNSIGNRMKQTYYSATDLGGLYGFAARTATGSIMGDGGGVQLESSTRMTGFGRSYWDQNIGGLGGFSTAAARRMVPRTRGQGKQYNPFKNQMPDWMPGVDYFTDFKHGDPYAKIPFGEARLPGHGYEKLNQLHPDFFGEYGAIDRFKILADVAPYSEQFKYYSSVVSRMHEAKMIEDSDYEQVGAIRKNVQKQKEKYDLHPYKFQFADIDKQKVTIERWIDKDTFLTKEHPGSPIKLAGISMPSLDDNSSMAEAARKKLNKVAGQGKRVTIGLDSDALNRVSDDTMGSMRAVVFANSGDPLNAKIARQATVSNLGKKKSPVTVDWDDTSAVGTRALYDDSEIRFGKKWEKFAHMDTPFHTKFLQVRSPLEMYKRKELYGKSWQSWGSPIKDFVKPAFNKAVVGNPLIRFAAGATVGSMFGITAQAKLAFGIAGGAIGSVASSVNSVGTLMRRTLGDTDYTWIPKVRREERDVDEYFDILKYVKYKGLYEKARRLAISTEGVDPEEIVNQAEKRKKKTSYTRGVLGTSKKWLKINKSHHLVDQDEMQAKINAVNEAEGELEGFRSLMTVGDYTTQALKYKKEYESTLFGADPHGDMQDIYRALPKKDKPFFKHFMTAAPSEREEILRLVPENQRRFYQAKWGLKVDKAPSLNSYLKKYNMPSAGWDGWKPEHSIDSMKIKVIENKGLEASEFGYYKDDVNEVPMNTPTASMAPNMNIDVVAIQRVLKGRGIKDADIILDMSPVLEGEQSKINLDVKVKHDRKRDISKLINSNPSQFLV